MKAEFYFMKADSFGFLMCDSYVNGFEKASRVAGLHLGDFFFNVYT